MFAVLWCDTPLCCWFYWWWSIKDMCPNDNRCKDSRGSRKIRVLRVLNPNARAKLPLCIYSSQYFANRNVQYCIFMKASMLNWQCVLFWQSSMSPFTTSASSFVCAWYQDYTRFCNTQTFSKSGPKGMIMSGALFASHCTGNLLKNPN